jgi:transcriptional regulator with XRE-family HTH domain
MLVSTVIGSWGASMTGDSLRQELAEFLKTRRARLTPTDVGLPIGSGRRTKGLRREEVAARAGVGLTWYTWLEQGRDIQVSTPFLENIARALLLTDAERAHLFALSNGRVPPLASSLAEVAQLDPERQAKIQTILDAIEAPAYARNNRFDVVAWNDANTEMFGDFAALPIKERNIIRRVFVSPYHRDSMLNWERDARALVARLRLNYGQASGGADFSEFIQEMRDQSDDFRRMWAHHDVTDAGEGVYLYKTRKHGIIEFRHSTLMPEAVPEIRIVIYFGVTVG